MAQEKLSLIEKCLQQERDGVPITEICGSADISERTFYYWKKKFRNMEQKQFEVLEKQQSKIEELNSTIKDLQYQVRLLKGRCQPFEDLAERKVLGTEQKKYYVNYLIDKYNYPLGLALDIIGLSRTAYKYKKISKNDVAVIYRLEQLAKEFPGGSCRQYIEILKEEKRGWNHKRVERIYGSLGLEYKYRKHF